MDGIVDTVGDTDILKVRKTAFLCSRQVPVGVILRCYDWAIEQRNSGRCVISGFHSTIEKDVLDYLLKGKQPIIVALHRGIGKEIRKQFASQIEAGRLLIISPFDPSRSRGGFREARVRNKLMVRLAKDIVVGHVSPGGELDILLKRVNKPVNYLGEKVVQKITREPLILKTRTGYYTYDSQPCSECGKLERMMYIYNKTSRGPVLLCEPCSIAARNRSFGRLDALDFAEFSHFESKRRKH